MLDQFKEHINDNLSFLAKSKLLIAISGGLDSVVLTYLCHLLKFNISLAHCNFNLRGQESDSDEDFVLSIAEDLDLEVFIENFDTESYAQESKQSIQMAARELRYNWFVELSEQLHFDYVLTAHHADDNLETYLINSIRGTGIDGLLGIPEVNGVFVRPLLPYSREIILKYASDNKIEWREDSTNASTKYLRNKLRHEVVPILKELNPNVLQSLAMTQSHLQNSKSIVEDAIARIQKKVISIDRNKILLNINKVKKLSEPKPYLYELLKDFGFTEWDDVLNIMNGQSGKMVQSSSHRLIKDRKYLIITELPSNKDFTAQEIDEVDTSAAIPSGSLQFKLVEKMEASDYSTIYVDKDLLKYPLTVRKWEKGDYFYPFGMTGKKKLSKYFKDEKWSIPEKEEVFLLSSADQKIIWIVGSRMDDRFKVTNQTNQILKISFQNET